MSAAGALLAADLLLVPWHRYRLDNGLERFGVEIPSFQLDRTGVQDPYALLGIAALVVAAAMVAHVAAARLHPGVPPPGAADLIAGAVVFGLVVAKLLAHNRFLGAGAWAGVLLAAGLAAGGYALSRDTGA